MDNTNILLKERVIYIAIREMLKHSDEIVFKGSYFFQKILGSFYREFKDIDFTLDTIMDNKEKIVKVRNLLLYINPHATCILREKKSFYQYCNCYYKPIENCYVRLECLVVAPTSKYVEKYLLCNPDNPYEHIEITVCTLEKMFIDKYFSLYYFLSDVYKGEQERISCAVDDIFMFLLSDRISVFLENDLLFKKIAMDKIKEDNILHYNQYGFILYSKQYEIGKRINDLFSAKEDTQKKKLLLLQNMVKQVFESEICKEEIKKWET